MTTETTDTTDRVEITPRLAVHQFAPEGYRAVLALEKYVASKVDHVVFELLKLRASMLNGCSFCVDMHSRDAAAAGEDTRRLFAVAAWREAPFFTRRERAALALTDAVTRLGEHGVPDDVWEEAAAVWSEEELANLILAIGTINLWNRIAITTHTPPPLTV
ncbi:alkylhydroperoxidase AhpD family core domain-containing protein [Cryptosporangium aurantiacum]|uniref:Alkylhydroperoxidase AhpD family core domain-containing protein n=2 Tax=Cryptosporangium aurantiacum TaxID=134849 RepID=A0A1M7Q7A9_9ACTN|nr:carboxymuconolactone decarboxylase family protein [Cryptosporangium aurantiacum]SHN26258.1 alkylhydroperoxidase AhpD family core domain-containing protein [Cryptosporangium aurantiacum]